MLFANPAGGHRNLASQLLQLGVLLLFPTVPALHHKTDYPRSQQGSRAHLRGRGGLLSGSLAASLAQATVVTLASGTPPTAPAQSALESTAHPPHDPQFMPSPAPKAARDSRLREAEVPHSKTPLGSAGGQGEPCTAPMSYLGQQPEGEEEHGVHGPAAGRWEECPRVRPRAELRLRLGQNPAE